MLSLANQHGTFGRFKDTKDTIMDTNNNTWALSQIRGWKQASNTLDTLLYYEFAQAEQRRLNERESLIQSAWAIRDNMLDRMKGFIKYGARETEPELRLITNICQTLELSERSITPLYRDHTA